MRQQLYRTLRERLGRSTQIVPAPLRHFVRRLTGGDAIPAQFTRGMLWHYRFFILFIIGTFLFSAVFEGTTLTAFMLAVQLLTSELAGESADLPQLFGGLNLDFLYDLERGAAFLLLVSTAIVTQLLRSGATYIGLIAAAYLTAWIERDVRRKVFARLMQMPYRDVASYKSGDLTSYMEQVTHIGNFVLRISDALNHLTIITVYVLLMLWISWPVALIGAVLLLALTYSLRSIRARIRDIAGHTLNKNVEFNEYVLEFLNGMRLIHVFDRRDYATQVVDQAIVETAHYRRRGLTWQRAIPGLIQSATIIALALFVVAAYYIVVEQGNAAFAPLALTFVVILYRLMPRAIEINAMIGAIAMWWPSVKRVSHFLAGLVENRPNQNAEPQRQAGPIRQIELRNVTLRYEADSPPAVDNVNLMISRGRQVAFVGASGAGKSSLVNLLLQLYKPTAGEILVNGVALDTLPTRVWIDQIGVVDQETFLFHDTVENNIRFGQLDATREQIVAAAKLANADQFIMQLPHGYQTMLGDRGIGLSGGQRQRVAIARALVKQPSILLFDEATSALDSASEQLIQQTIEQLRGQQTVIAIAHRLSTIANFDEIIVMERGQIIERGTHDTLLAQNGQYAQLWALQAKRTRHE